MIIASLCGLGTTGTCQKAENTRVDTLKHLSNKTKLSSHIFIRWQLILSANSIIAIKIFVQYGQCMKLLILDFSKQVKKELCSYVMALWAGQTERPNHCIHITKQANRISYIIQQTNPLPNPAMRSISLQVPEGAEPGDSLSFIVDGKGLEVPVPEGSQPGDVLQIQVGGNDDNDADEAIDDLYGNHHELCPQQPHDGDDKDSTTTLVLKIGNIKLELSSAVSSEDVGKQGLPQGTTIDDGTYAHPWPSGKAMTDFWGHQAAKDLMKSLFSRKNASGRRNEASAEGLRVLELGSGMGGVGLSFAASYSEMPKSLSLLPLHRVVLSDVPAGMPLLEQNLGCNRAVLPKEATVEARELLWTTNEEDGKDTKGDDKFDLILASDVFYNTESIPALVATIKRYLDLNDKGSSAVLMAVRWRKPQLERRFFEASDGWNNKRWQPVHSSHCPLSWKEYGDPTSQASNLYFHQTMVSVQGQPHALAEILASHDTDGDKEDNSRPLQEKMTDQEAGAFEKFFIQIYCLSELDLSDKATTSKKRPLGGIDEIAGRKKSCQDHTE